MHWTIPLFLPPCPLVTTTQPVNIWLYDMLESSSSSQGISLKGWVVLVGNDVAFDSRYGTTCLFQASGFLIYFFFFLIWNTSRICMSSLHRAHANLLCIVPILVYALLKRAHTFPKALGQRFDIFTSPLPRLLSHRCPSNSVPASAILSESCLLVITL